MWPIVMSVAAAKYGGDAFTEGGLGPVAPRTDTTAEDDVDRIR